MTIKFTGYVLASLLSAVVLSAPALAQKTVPTDPFTGEPGLLQRNDMNLTGEKYLKSLTPDSYPQDQRSADMYMLGVADATEGKVWCSYKRAKIGTLREWSYEYISKLPAERLQEKASKLLLEALEKHFPCEKENNK